MDQARLEFQRNFYHLLLELAAERHNLTTSLKSALQLIADVTDAERAYLEVRDTKGVAIYQTIEITEQEIEEIQQAISTGIIAEAVKTREILLIPSALIDPRFSTQKSV